MQLILPFYINSVSESNAASFPPLQFSPVTLLRVLKKKKEPDAVLCLCTMAIHVWIYTSENVSASLVWHNYRETSRSISRHSCVSVGTGKGGRGVFTGFMPSAPKLGTNMGISNGDHTLTLARTKRERQKKNCKELENCLYLNEIELVIKQPLFIWTLN